jgi:hypothetical protein
LKEKICIKCQNKFDDSFTKCPFCGSEEFNVVGEDDKKIKEVNPKIGKFGFLSYLNSNQLGAIIVAILDLIPIIYFIIMISIHNDLLDSIKGLGILFIFAGIGGIICLFFLNKLFQIEAKIYTKNGTEPSTYRLVIGTLATYIIALLPQILWIFPYK